MVVAVCVLDRAELSVCDTETVLVFELLAEPVSVGVPVLLLDRAGLAEYVAEKLLMGLVVGEKVVIELAERLYVPVFDTVFVTEILGLNVVVLDLAPAAENVLEAECVDVIVTVFVILIVRVWVNDTLGVCVILSEPVPDTDTVEVLLLVFVLVFVGVDDCEAVNLREPVCVREPLDEAEYVDVTVDVLDPAIDFVGVELVVVVLDDVVVAVLVAVLGIVRVIFDDKETDGLAEFVLEAAGERVFVGEPVEVLETGPVLDCVGVPLDVFDIVVVDVCVFDRCDERVSAEVPVFVFEVADETDAPGELDDVLDDEPVRVDVIVDVTVLVVVLDGLTGRVAAADFDNVVVFVDVLLVVVVDVGIMPEFALSTLLNLSTVVKSYSTTVFSEFTIEPNSKSNAVRRSILMCQ